MIAAIMNYKLELGHHDEMEAIAASAPDSLKGVKGFVNAIYYSDKEKGEYGSITVWETKEDFEAALNSMPSEVGDTLQSLSVEPPDIKTYYVNNNFSA